MSNSDCVQVHPLSTMNDTNSTTSTNNADSTINTTKTLSANVAAGVREVKKLQEELRNALKHRFETEASLAEANEPDNNVSKGSACISCHHLDKEVASVKNYSCIQNKKLEESENARKSLTAELKLAKQSLAKSIACSLKLKQQYSQQTRNLVQLQLETHSSKLEIDSQCLVYAAAIMGWAAPKYNHRDNKLLVTGWSVLSGIGSVEKVHLFYKGAYIGGCESNLESPDVLTHFKNLQTPGEFGQCRFAKTYDIRLDPNETSQNLTFVGTIEGKYGLLQKTQIVITDIEPVPTVPTVPSVLATSPPRTTPTEQKKILQNKLDRHTDNEVSQLKLQLNTTEAKLHFVHTTLCKLRYSLVLTQLLRRTQQIRIEPIEQTKPTETVETMEQTKPISFSEETSEVKAPIVNNQSTAKGVVLGLTVGGLAGVALLAYLTTRQKDGTIQLNDDNATSESDSL